MSAAGDSKYVTSYNARQSGKWDFGAEHEAPHSAAKITRVEFLDRVVNRRFFSHLFPSRRASLGARVSSNAIYAPQVPTNNLAPTCNDFHVRKKEAAQSAHLTAKKILRRCCASVFFIGNAREREREILVVRHRFMARRVDRCVEIIHLSTSESVFAILYARNSKNIVPPVLSPPSPTQRESVNFGR